MSRPDLQTGFNGWQAIDPTPPPQFWQKNGGGNFVGVLFLFLVLCSVKCCFISQTRRTVDHGLLKNSDEAHLPLSLFVVAKLDSLTIPPT
jgi:hypothetical protein